MNSKQVLVGLRNLIPRQKRAGCDARDDLSYVGAWLLSVYPASHEIAGIHQAMIPPTSSHPMCGMVRGDGSTGPAWYINEGMRDDE